VPNRIPAGGCYTEDGILASTSNNLPTHVGGSNDSGIVGYTDQFAVDFYAKIN